MQYIANYVYVLEVTSVLMNNANERLKIATYIVYLCFDRRAL